MAWRQGWQVRAHSSTHDKKRESLIIIVLLYLLIRLLPQKEGRSHFLCVYVFIDIFLF